MRKSRGMSFEKVVKFIEDAGDAAHVLDRFEKYVPVDSLKSDLNLTSEELRRKTIEDGGDPDEIVRRAQVQIRRLTQQSIRNLRR